MYYGKQQLSTFTLRRIVFIGGVNTAPVAAISTDASLILLGETVSLNGASSVDADGDSLSYRWDFGDGDTGSGVAVTHSYDRIGSYTVMLTVNDGNGGVNTASTEIVVGVPPVVEITSPLINAEFAVGEILQLQGQAVDALGNPIVTLEWEVRQHHSTHFHPFLSPTRGNSIALDEAPAPEDFLAATNSHLEILLTATDDYGLSSTVSRTVMPKMVELDFDTSPSGIDIYLDDFRIETPQRIVTWENHALKVFAPDTTSSDFDEWNDGSNQTHILVVPPATDEIPIFVAAYSYSWGAAWLDFLTSFLQQLFVLWGGGD